MKYKIVIKWEDLLIHISFGAVIICNLYYLYLVDVDTDKIMGIIARDFALILAIIWGGYYWIKMIKKTNPDFKYGKWLFAFCGLALLSSLQSYRLYGQPIVQGFAPQRLVLVWAFMYFPIRKLIYYGRLKYSMLQHILHIIGVIQIILFISQYVFGVGVELLYVNTGYRNGATRYYFSPVLLDFLFLLYLDQFNKGKLNEKIYAIIMIGLILFETMIVQQYRLTTAGLIICLGLFVILMRTRKFNKIFYLVLGAFILFALLNTPMMQNILDSVLNNAFDAGMAIRNVGRMLYFETLFMHPLLGGGNPSSFYMPAREAAGINNLIYLSDNGIFGFMYIYGGLGLVWVITLWKKIIKDAVILQKRKRELAFVLFPIFFAITCINELHWYWEYGFVVFSIYLALLDSRVAEVKRQNEGGSY